MYPIAFYFTMMEMGFYLIAFHFLFTFYYPIENQLFQKYSVNMMRSLMCSYFCIQGTKYLGDVWTDVCLLDENRLTNYKNLHYQFLAYFIFDTIILFYQKYLKIEKRIRKDLLFHHILAIFSLMSIQKYGLYGISSLICVSEGMSIVSGLKLIFMEKGPKELMKFCVRFRLLYLVFIRMLYLWPVVIYYYHTATNQCENLKESKNMPLILGLIALIYHAEIRWIHSGRGELMRI